MNEESRRLFNKEMRMARELIQLGQLDAAFVHLERAHVIGQRYVAPHCNPTGGCCVSVCSAGRPLRYGAR